jgi:hypothetical protein
MAAESLVDMPPFHYPNYRAQHGEHGSALLLDVEPEIVCMMSPSFNPFANIYFIRPPF